ncbi:MAG: malonic semialdehyde reductase [Arenicellales bacterium]
MQSSISQEALGQILSEARTYPGWLDQPVEDDLLRRLYELARWGPTSMNTQPMRLLFVKSTEAKKKLLQAVAPGNIPKVEAAPVTVIVAQDMAFHTRLRRMVPHMKDPESSFNGKQAYIEDTAYRNSTLQGGYLLMTARALGLDAGPMSGFNQEKLDALFFEGTSFRSNFIMNLGYGDPSSVHPRAPRFEFDEVCQIV